MRIVDADDKPVANGTVGEIVVRGDNVMMGYWERPEETAKAVIDGWMHTGDGGYMDEHGFVFVVDRVKDMIISGGENVYSVEVENAIASIPPWRNAPWSAFRTSAGANRFTPWSCSRPARRSTANELIEFCKTLIAGYKCPRSVDLSGKPAAALRRRQGAQARTAQAVLGKPGAAGQLGRHFQAMASIQRAMASTISVSMPS